MQIQTDNRPDVGNCSSPLGNARLGGQKITLLAKIKQTRVQFYTGLCWRQTDNSLAPVQHAVPYYGFFFFAPSQWSSFMPLLPHCQHRFRWRKKWWNFECKCLTSMGLRTFLKSSKLKYRQCTVCAAPTELFNPSVLKIEHMSDKSNGHASILLWTNENWQNVKGGFWLVCSGAVRPIVEEI